MPSEFSRVFNPLSASKFLLPLRSELRKTIMFFRRILIFFASRQFAQQESPEFKKELGNELLVVGRKWLGSLFCNKADNLRDNIFGSFNKGFTAGEIGQERLGINCR